MTKHAFKVILTTRGKTNGVTQGERQKECEPLLHRTTPATHIHEPIPSRQSYTQIKHQVRNLVARINGLVSAS